MPEACSSTKILVIEEDQTNFQVRHCIAQALGLTNSIDLIYAYDVSEALRIMEKSSPDVILFSEEDLIEKEMLLDFLGEKHPPLILQTEDDAHFSHKQKTDQKIMYVPVYDTLEGMHQVLMLAASMGQRCKVGSLSQEVH